MRFLKTLSWIFAIGLFASLISVGEVGRADEGVGSLHVQDGGRIKPLDTLARESLQLIHGRTSFREKKPLDIFLTWILAPESWENVEFIEVRHSGLRDVLRFPHDRFLFSPKEFYTNDRVALVIKELQSERSRGGKLNPYYQSVARLENQLSMFLAIKSGEAVHLIPPKEGTKWVALSELNGELREAFLKMVSNFAQSLGAEPSADLLASVAHFKNLARAENPEAYGSDQMMNIEIHFNALHPFRWAWVLYLSALAMMALFALFANVWLKRLSWMFLSAGLFLHIYGIVLRCVINGRPPVSNMYETVVWVPLGVLVISVALAVIYRVGVILTASTIVAIFCLILADIAPAILDASLQPLEPVLRSNFWLSTHVVIITLSYAGFFLAFALGDFLLFFYLRDEMHYAQKIQIFSQALYRSIQVGVVLLAAGIILGGVWADYSWGRFWGWDPKETWALIALLGYLALLHARIIGLVRGFGMAVGSVCAFSLVIMAWYGVNFVLGAGLHSYGFGAGGVEYVSAFVAAHLVYASYVAFVRRKKSTLVRG